MPQLLIPPNITLLEHVRMYIRQISPITGLEWPRGFQEVKVPRFHDKAQDGG